MYRILLLLFLVSQFGFGQNEHICKDLSHIIEMETKTYNSKFTQTVNEATQNYDLKYHRLEWQVDPAVKYISGEVTSYFVTTEDAVNQINFDFSEALDVNEVLYHGNSLSFSKTADDNLQIDLPVSLDINTLDSLTVIYQGEPTSSGFGSFEVNSHNGTPVMWTLSEPYGAKEWWPCKQDLSDKIDSIDIYVKTLTGYRVASNGLLKNEIEEGGFTTYHWQHRYPIPAYLIAIAITDYAVYSDFVPYGNNKSIEVLNYVYPENTDYAMQNTTKIVDVMTLFNELFEIYPFAEEKYGHAEFGWGGGMEHQTMSFMGSFNIDLQAHELAHQWFGDKITCGSWEDIWLNEGFATYLTGLARQINGGDVALYEWRVSRVNSIVSQPGGSVWVDDTTSVGRIFSGRLTYNKGAMLLSMLRWKIGDEAFFDGIRNYLVDPDLAFGYAKTEDLKNHLEASSGQDLTEYFNDWFYNQGFPSYQANWSNTNTGISIELSQTTSHESVDFFEMPVPILISGSGNDTIIRFEHKNNGQIFEIDLDFEVENITIDPQLMLISDNNVVQEVIVGVEELDAESEQVNVYPNPFDEQIFLEFKDVNNLPETLVITDISGRIIERQENIHRDYVVNLKALEAGSYIIRLEYKDKVVSKKMVKE